MNQGRDAASAVAVPGDVNHQGRLVLICEHASNHLPAPYVAGPRSEHWGWDIGAADVVGSLRRATGSVSVCAQFSRLLIDPNRPVEASDLVPTQVDGHAVTFNRGVCAAEVRRRTERFYDPYHAAVDGVLEARAGRDTLLFSVHSFTPVWAGERRTMELGVLFDDHDDLAASVGGALARDGWAVALNAPYSGKEGLAYSPHRHGTAHGVPYLELEVRNDLLRDPAGVARVVASVRRALGV